jgi:hypothetical protein
VHKGECGRAEAGEERAEELGERERGVDDVCKCAVRQVRRARSVRKTSDAAGWSVGRRAEKCVGG